MTTWNKTGTVVGSFSQADLIDLIEDSTNNAKRRQFAVWLSMLKETDCLVVSLPYKGSQKPTVEE